MADYSKNFEVAMMGRNGMDSITEETVSNDPGDPKTLVYEDYYKNSAKLLHYKNVLNDKLKEKNPEGFAQHFAGLKPFRDSLNEKGASEFMKTSQWNDYLSPAEVQSTLGNDGYSDYLDSLKVVNKFNISQGKEALFGNVEGEGDITNLNYGRRFASLQANPRYSYGHGDAHYARQYKYDPDTKQVIIAEEGNLANRPTWLPAPK